MANRTPGGLFSLLPLWVLVSIHFGLLIPSACRQAWPGQPVAGRGPSPWGATWGTQKSRVCVAGLALLGSKVARRGTCHGPCCHQNSRTRAQAGRGPAAHTRLAPLQFGAKPLVLNSMSICLGKLRQGR